MKPALYNYGTGLPVAILDLVSSLGIIDGLADTVQPQNTRPICIK